MSEQHGCPASVNATMFSKLQSFCGFASPSVEACIPWLQDAGLMFTVKEIEIEAPSDAEIRRDMNLGVPVHRCEPKTRGDLQELRKRFKGKPLPCFDAGGDPVGKIWDDHRNRRDRVLALQINPVPADAIACYWPFHMVPSHWGIYISVPRLLEYMEHLLEACRGKLCLLGNVESILRCVLFEIFHHEFFHHMRESTATTMEILSAAFGNPKPLYREYRRHAYEGVVGEHPHKPLEEALANAYAHNSFGFISRVKLGYKAAEASLFQEVLQAGWAKYGPGYKHAGQYISQGQGKQGYVSGAAQLIAMILNSTEVDVAALTMVAEKVMPRGHTAFCEKAAVPTYLVGPQEAINFLLENVPAPNETYTTFFWQRETEEIDKALRARKVQESRKKQQDLDTVPHR